MFVSEWLKALEVCCGFSPTIATRSSWCSTHGRLDSATGPIDVGVAVNNVSCGVPKWKSQRGSSCYTALQLHVTTLVSYVLTSQACKVEKQLH
jgi:hypothetical protein